MKRANQHSHADAPPPECASDVPDPAASADATPPPSELESLRSQLEEKQAAYLRALADSQNTRRRADADVAGAHGRGVAQFARSVLPVLEHLDLAVGHDLASLDAQKLATAVEMVRTDLLRTLESNGVTRIAPTIGEAFDPHLHQAVLQQAVEGVAPGQISMCLQAGYRFGETLLQPARVAVAPE